MRAGARAAVGELLTAVLTQADLPCPVVQAVVGQLTPAGRPVTVEQLTVVLDQLGFGLRLVAAAYSELGVAERGGDAGQRAGKAGAGAAGQRAGAA
jgi:hypothetical protein